MKKILSMLLIVGLVFVFSACSSNDGDYNTGENEGVVEEVGLDNESGGNALELISRGTWDTEDAKGYKVQGEIETTDLIKASDWGAVESTFDTFGYPEPLPSFDTLAPDGANQDTSAMLIGRISLTNTTDGWDFSENSPYECKLVFGAPDLYGYNASSLCVMYGDGMQKFDFGGNRGYLDTSAVMNSNDWVVPFIIVIPEVFTPNEPNGSESVLNAKLKISGHGGELEFAMPGLAE